MFLLWFNRVSKRMVVVVYRGEEVIVSFCFEIIITRLKRMCFAHRFKRNHEGLSSIVLVVVFSLIFSACGDSGSHKNANRDANAEYIFKGTVRQIVGDVQFKTSDGESGHLEVGHRIFEKNKIVAEPRSSVVISVSDGSALKMDGRTEVEFDAEVQESLKREFLISLRHGRLMFDIQKQAVKDEFEIRTDRLAMVAGNTAGFVENVDGLEVSSLKDGRLEVGSNGLSSIISSGQTLIANDNGVKVLSLSSSGTLILARAIDSIATEASSQLGIRATRLALDKLENLLMNYDSAYKKKLDSFIKKTQPQFKPKALNEYIGKPSVSLEAQFVPGNYVMVLGDQDTISESGLYKHSFEWEDSTAYGSKRFIVNCSNDEVEYICHTWNTNFVSAKMAEILTKADGRKSVAVTDSMVQPKKSKSAIVIEGSGRERIHVLPEERDIPATLRFSVTGFLAADLTQIKKIIVKRKGSVIKTFSGNELMTNSFKLPIRLKQNRIAHFQVVVVLVNGKRVKAGKVYETYCYFDNYEGGKKSNRVNDMSAEEEYKNVVSKRLLKNE